MLVQIKTALGRQVVRPLPTEDLRGSELFSIPVISTPVSMSVLIYPCQLLAITGGKRAQLGKLIPGDLAQTGFLSAHKLSANRL